MAPDADAALELSVVDVNLHHPKTKSPAWWNSKALFAVAYLDPLAKQSTGTLAANRRRKLFFPLSSSVLLSQDDSSHVFLTLELLSPSRLPFHSSAKLLGTATLPLSAIRLSSESFALRLLRPSGNAAGSITVSARVLWDLGFRREEPDRVPDAGCPSAPPIDLMVVDELGMSDPSRSEVDLSCDSLWSSDAAADHELAPPGDVCCVCGESEVNVVSTCRESELNFTPACAVVTKDECNGEAGTGDVGTGSGGDKGRMVMGLIGGVAALVVGVACHRMKVKPFFLTALVFN